MRQSVLKFSHYGYRLRGRDLAASPWLRQKRVYLDHEMCVMTSDMGYIVFDEAFQGLASFLRGCDGRDGRAIAGEEVKSDHDAVHVSLASRKLRLVRLDGTRGTCNGQQQHIRDSKVAWD